MWVKVQDKTWSYEINNFGRFELSPRIYSRVDGRNIILGEYKTKERAGEIMQELEEHKCKGINSIYEMPII